MRWIGPLACHACGIALRSSQRRATAKYCSRACFGDAQRGRGEGKTYRKRNGRHEHRLVAEQKLGRPLLPGEVVHHEDETRHNNAPDNLDVLPSQAEHARLHFTGTKQSPEHVRKRVISRRETLRRKADQRESATQ